MLHLGSHTVTVCLCRRNFCSLILKNWFYEVIPLWIRTGAPIIAGSFPPCWVSLFKSVPRCRCAHRLRIVCWPYLTSKDPAAAWEISELFGAGLTVTVSEGDWNDISGIQRSRRCSLSKRSCGEKIETIQVKNEGLHVRFAPVTCLFRTPCLRSLQCANWSDRGELVLLAQSQTRLISRPDCSFSALNIYFFYFFFWVARSPCEGACIWHGRLFRSRTSGQVLCHGRIIQVVMHLGFIVHIKPVECIGIKWAACRGFNGGEDGWQQKKKKKQAN